MCSFYGCGRGWVTCSKTPKNHRATKEDNNKTWYRWLLFMMFVTKRKNMYRLYNIVWLYENAILHISFVLLNAMYHLWLSYWKTYIIRVLLNTKTCMICVINTMCHLLLSCSTTCMICDWLMKNMYHLCY